MQKIEARRKKVKNIDESDRELSTMKTAPSKRTITRFPLQVTIGLWTTGLYLEPYQGSIDGDHMRGKYWFKWWFYNC